MGNLKHTEVELKFPLGNPEEVTRKLNSVAKIDKKEDYQKDTYYVVPHRNFLEQKPISEWLRIRETKKSSNLNYKNWHNTDKIQAVSCDEFETVVGDITALKKIFKSLDFKEIIIVEKTRTTWGYKDVLMAIDNVTELGYFIELEAKGDFKNIDEAKKHLYAVLEELDIKTSSQDLRGYPYRLLEKQGYNFNN